MCSGYDVGKKRGYYLLQTSRGVIKRVFRNIGNANMPIKLKYHDLMECYTFLFMEENALVIFSVIERALNCVMS